MNTEHKPASVRYDISDGKDVREAMSGFDTDNFGHAAKKLK